MGLFDKLFNDDEKEKQEEAKRKAAEKYAEEHSHSHEEEHAQAPAEPVKKTAAKKTAAASAAGTAGATAAAGTAAKKAAVVHTPESHAAEPKAPAAKAAAPNVALPHQPNLASPAHDPAAGPHHTHAASIASAVTAAHDQAMTLHILAHIPDHQPREDDPHYHLFELAKNRLKRQGLWKCMINDDLCNGEPELHHTFIEFSQINEVDPAKVQQALGLHFANDEEFQVWAESPGNLEVLCVAHHRAHFGIHMMPGPLWEAVRFRKKGTAAAAEFVPSSEASS